MSGPGEQPPQLIASSNPDARANPMIWEGEEAAQGVFLGTGSDDPLALLGMPSLELPAAPRLPEDFTASPALRRWLETLREAIAEAVEGGNPAALPLHPLDALSTQAVVEILGEGEVTGSVTLDGVRYRIRESLLTGVWRLEGDDGSHRVEVAALPEAVLTAAFSLGPGPFAVPAAHPGLMNAPAVLAEISDRSAAWTAGDAAHVMNFTLLPMSDEDQATLREVLGRADLVLESGGFGRCRVFATRYRHVWAVQYLNALDHIILDTVEIGPPPAAVVAAPEDFQDSADRLAQLLETYLQ